MRHALGRLAAAFLLSAVTLHPSIAQQAYPLRPIKLVVAAAPATATDATARYLAEKIGRELKTSVVVENKMGANGVIGTDFVAKSAADGYTLLFGGSPTYINKSLYRSLPYDPVRDFKPVAQVAAAYLVLAVPANSPFQNVKDLVRHIKSNPKAISYSSAGSGSTTHLAPALMLSMAGGEAVHVPYKGGGEALMDTISGQVQMTFTGIASVVPQVRSGKLRPLAVTGPKRTASLPTVPTLAESGFAGYDVASRLGVLAPAGVSPAVVQTLSSAIARIAATDEFRTFCEDRGMDVDFLAHEAYTAAAPGEVERWGKMITLAGAKVD